MKLTILSLSIPLWSATGLTFLILDPPTLLLHNLILFIFLCLTFLICYILIDILLILWS